VGAQTVAALTSVDVQHDGTAGVARVQPPPFTRPRDGRNLSAEDRSELVWALEGLAVCRDAEPAAWCCRRRCYRGPAGYTNRSTLQSARDGVVHVAHLLICWAAHGPWPGPARSSTATQPWMSLWELRFGAAIRARLHRRWRRAPRPGAAAVRCSLVCGARGGAAGRPRLDEAQLHSPPRHEQAPPPPCLDDQRGSTAAAQSAATASGAGSAPTAPASDCSRSTLSAPD
jgi:hypothetical protein